MRTVPTTECSECGKTRAEGDRFRRGRCSSCYRATLATGERVRETLQGLSVSERLWARIDTSGGAEACWPYTGRVAGEGYATMAVDGTPRLVHRLVYEEKVGPIPDGYQVDHVCHDPDTCPAAPIFKDCQHRRCCNPSPKHLRAVTPRENTLRSGAPSADNRGKEECPLGHPYDEANTRVNIQGKRNCRECARASWRAWNAARKEAGWKPSDEPKQCERCWEMRTVGEFRAGICGACRTARKRAVERGEDPELAVGGPRFPEFCKRGHRFSPENTRIMTKAGGKMQRACRACIWMTQHRGQALPQHYAQYVG